MFPYFQHSWKWCLHYRCQNVNRHIKSDGKPSKRAKLDSQPQSVHLCPPVLADDEVSYARNLSLLEAELRRPKHRAEVIKELLRQTFPNRWDAYVNGDPPTVLEYLQRYPVLMKAAYVCRICMPFHYVVLLLWCPFLF